jgi:hypothetical protein
MKYSELYVAMFVLTVSLRQAVWTTHASKVCNSLDAGEKPGIDLDRLSIDLDDFTSTNKCYLAHFFTSRANSFHDGSLYSHIATNHYYIVFNA